MRIKIEGRQPLRGTYRVAGSSNSAMSLIAASLLTDAPVTLTNVPDTVSVGVMLEVGASLGLKIDEGADGRGGDVKLDASKVFGRALEREHTDALSGTILFLAPILARRRHARMTIDYAISRIHPHLTALRDLGVNVKVDDGVIDLDAQPWENAEIVLTQTSVTATALVCMLAAALGKETTIINAASEPHIVELQQFLSWLGVTVRGMGSNLITVEGMGGRENALKPQSKTPIPISPDYVEAASVAAMAALTGGRLTIEGVRRRDLRLIAKVYERLGLHISLDDDALVVPKHERFEISSREEDVDVSIESSPWPGFPSDLIPLTTVIATQARGTVLIHEKLYSNRLLLVDRLNAMNAQIIHCDPHRAIVIGSTPLQGIYIDNPDVRTGLAMLTAALCAEGETTIDAAETFDRYFAHVPDKLTALGAKIKRSEA
ncbi:MAG: UDP-N-acetylglucosamine 1-carboxyvinyltransferase [Anaerolineae bacterium]|nr:UDP-N-acetylglucosamine 1-carboxyvinyltransferase [Anaerolineae bacterium]